MPIGHPFLFDSLHPRSLTHVIRWNNANTEIPQLVPAQLWPSKNELVRLVDQWKEFKIHKITFRWVPVVKGPPKKVDTGWISSDASPVNDYGMRGRAQVWIMNPPTMPDLFGGFQPQDASHWWDPNMKYTGPIANADIRQMKFPKPVKRFMDKPFAITIKPKIRSNKIVSVQESNGPVNYGVEQDVILATQKAFPWMPLLNSRIIREDDLISGAALDTAEANLTGHKVIIKQPFLACKDMLSGVWMDNVPIPGTWYITTYMYVRGRRHVNAPQIIDVDPRLGTVTMQSTNPDNPWTTA